MTEVAVIVKGGMVQAVYGSDPIGIDVEILDLDTLDPEEEQVRLERLKDIEQELCKIY